MPLAKCPDCGNEISPSAPSCPHCGRPKTAVAPTKKGMSRVTLTVLIVIAFVYAMSVAQKSDNKSPASATSNSAPSSTTQATAAAIDKEVTVSLTLVEAQNVAVAWCGANDGVITSQTTNTITCRTRYQTQHLMIVPAGNGYVHITRVIE
jgi:hypothetical protein